MAVTVRSDAHSDEPTGSTAGRHGRHSGHTDAARAAVMGQPPTPRAAGVMARLLELTIVLSAIVVPSLLASKQGSNFGTHDAGRAAKGAVAAAAILQGYKIFKGNKNETGS